jgi:hypothetical protein
MESILTSIKKLLGIEEEYEHFDSDIIMHINSVFMILNQLGVGPSEGFSIEDAESVWTDYIPDGSNLEAVKTYIHHQVKLMFDPPQSSAHIEALKRTISELEWRLNIQTESLPNSAKKYTEVLLFDRFYVESSDSPSLVFSHRVTALTMTLFDKFKIILDNYKERIETVTTIDNMSYIGSGRLLDGLLPTPSEIPICLAWDAVNDEFVIAARNYFGYMTLYGLKEG